MGVRFPSVASTTVANVLPASAAETVICVLPAFDIPLDFAQIIIEWFAQITVGTSTTSLVFRIRRGTTVAGAQIGAAPWTFTTVAANLVSISGQYVDTPGAVGGQQYCLTCVQTADTVAGTLSDVCLVAYAL